MKSKLIFRIFVNSVPKSGTHLLTRIVSLLGYRSTSSNRYVIQKILTRMRLGHPNVFTFPTVNRNLIKIMYDWYDKIHPHVKVPIGVTLRAQVSHNLMYRWLLSIHPGCFVSGHVPWSQTTDQILKQLGFKHVIIVRDPRDVLISFVHHVMKPEHPLKDDFSRLSENERVIFAIKGGYTPVSKIHMRGIKDVFYSVINWRQSNNVLILRFEDLVGVKGGGSYSEQIKSLKEICNYLEINVEDKDIEKICENAFDVSSATFRKGQIGTWREELTPQQLTIFYEYSGKLLDELHYEYE